MLQFLKRLRLCLSNARTRVFRRLGWIVNDRAAGLPEEVRFWTSALSDPERCWNVEEFRERLRPDLPLQDALRALIDLPEGGTARILDVGAGPLTRVGRIWPGHSVEIVPVDPLAGEYRKIFAEISLRPVVETQPGEAEKLVGQFGENVFDLAYASNSLDHAVNPLLAIRQMVAVVKPGAAVYLWHFWNAGLTERYQGLHAWNFRPEGGDMLLDDGRTVFSLREEMRTVAEVEVHEERAFDSRVVVAILRKRRDS